MKTALNPVRLPCGHVIIDGPIYCWVNCGQLLLLDGPRYTRFGTAPRDGIPNGNASILRHPSTYGESRHTAWKWYRIQQAIITMMRQSAAVVGEEGCHQPLQQIQCTTKTMRAWNLTHGNQTTAKYESNIYTCKYACIYDSDAREYSTSPSASIRTRAHCFNRGLGLQRRTCTTFHVSSRPHVPRSVQPRQVRVRYELGPTVKSFEK